MTTQPWWQSGVIYQIYPLSFADSDGDGIGDLRGIIQHLDHLGGAPDALGVDAIWLSPIYPSPRRDFGYDVSDYTAIDPALGTLADFDELVADCHRRGIRVILDLVLNHTSDQHPWFAESRASRESTRRDWYIWRDGRGPGQPPNNWLSTFGGPAWTYDAATRQWYLHGFLPEQPDVNWRNPAVEGAMLDVVRFWLERGVDGFRLDVVNHYVKDAEFRDNPIARPLAPRPYDRQQHLHDKDQPELHGILRRLRALLDRYPERMSVGEVHSDRMAEAAAALYGAGDDELHLAFNFAFTRSPWDPAAFQRAILEWEKLLPPGAWPPYALSNHDQTRHITRYGRRDAEARARVAAALLLTLRGAPFLYYGEEIGLPQTFIPRDEILDPPGRRYWPLYRGRDGCRTPMPWDGSPGAGFTSGRPWLRLGPDASLRNVAAQRADPRSLLAFYRRLIRLRRETPALRLGRQTFLQEQPREALGYLRETEGQAVWVLLNLVGRPICYVPEVRLPSRRWKVLLSTAGRRGEELPGLAPVFAPYEVAILEARP